MKELGYGKDYQYAHDFEGGITGQEYFPDRLKDRTYYHPTTSGREKKIADYLAWYKEERKLKKSEK